MVSGIIVVAAFGLLAALGLALVMALFRVSGRPAAGGDGSQTGQKGS